MRKKRLGDVTNKRLEEVFNDVLYACGGDFEFKKPISDSARQVCKFAGAELFGLFRGKYRGSQKVDPKVFNSMSRKVERLCLNMDLSSLKKAEKEGYLLIVTKGDIVRGCREGVALMHSRLSAEFEPEMGRKS